MVADHLGRVTFLARAINYGLRIKASSFLDQQRHTEFSFHTNKLASRRFVSDSWTSSVSQSASWVAVVTVQVPWVCRQRFLML